jgi:hypothetical protein
MLCVPFHKRCYLDSSSPIACDAATIPKTEVTHTDEPNPAQLRPVATAVVSQLSCDVG